MGNKIRAFAQDVWAHRWLVLGGLAWVALMQRGLAQTVRRGSPPSSTPWPCGRPMPPPAIW